MFCSRFVVLFEQLFIFVGIFPWVISLFIVFPVVVMFNIVRVLLLSS